MLAISSLSSQGLHQQDEPDQATLIMTVHSHASLCIPIIQVHCHESQCTTIIQVHSCIPVHSHVSQCTPMISVHSHQSQSTPIIQCTEMHSSALSLSECTVLNRSALPRCNQHSHEPLPIYLLLEHWSGLGWMRECTEIMGVHWDAWECTGMHECTWIIVVHWDSFQCTEIIRNSSLCPKLPHIQNFGQKKKGVTSEEEWSFIPPLRSPPFFLWTIAQNKEHDL